LWTRTAWRKASPRYGGRSRRSRATTTISSPCRGEGISLYRRCQVAASEDGSTLPELTTVASMGSSGPLFQKHTIQTSVITTTDEEKEQLSLPAPRNRAFAKVVAVLAVAEISVAGIYAWQKFHRAPAAKSSGHQFDWLICSGPPFHRRSRFSQSVRPSRRRMAVRGPGGNVEHRTGGRRESAPGFGRRRCAHHTRSSSGRHLLRLPTGDGMALVFFGGLRRNTARVPASHLRPIRLLRAANGVSISLNSLLSRIVCMG